MTAHQPADGKVVMLEAIDVITKSSLSLTIGFFLWSSL